MKKSNCIKCKEEVFTTDYDPNPVCTECDTGHYCLFCEYPIEPDSPYGAFCEYCHKKAEAYETSKKWSKGLIP